MISVITVNYNGLSDTRNFLQTFRSNIKSINYEMIVVDNASTCNESQILNQEFDWIKCIRSDVNLGFSGGNNLGMYESNGDYLLFINNDIIVRSDFITPLVDLLESNSKIAAVSPKILNLDGSLCYGGCKPLGKHLLNIHYISGDEQDLISEVSETPLIYGAAVLIRKDVLEYLKGWPGIYFLYSEEVDLSLHIRALGYSLWYNPLVEVYHVGSASTGKGSPLVYYYNSRNRLLLYKRNLKGLIKMLSISYHLIITVPHNCFKLLFNKQYALCKAYCLGVKDFCRNNFYERKI